MKLIDKAALVAEIKRRKELVSDPILLGNDLMIGERNAYSNLLPFLDTLEVKEVDLEKLIDDYMLPITAQDVKKEPFTQLEKCAKHFFKLGLKVRRGE